MAEPTITRREFRLGRATYNAEHIRILRAAARGALTQNEHGRWVITDDERRPARRERERLLHRNLLVAPGGWGTGDLPAHPAKLSSGGEYLLQLINAAPRSDTGETT